MFGRTLRFIPRAAIPVATVSLFASYKEQEQHQAHCGALDFLFGNKTESCKTDIKNIIDSVEEKRDDGTSIAPTFIRLAWHASGTYSKKEGNGGSGGATMRFSPEKDWGANAGLAEARSMLNPLAAKHGMSIADVWTLAGATAVEAMGGPAIKWRAGRSDSSAPTTVPDGRLPDADNNGVKKDLDHLRKIFYRMGFNDQEIVALSGAHAVGRCHENASGFWGPWTYAESTFSNEYFRLLIEEKWTPKRTHNGKPWKGPNQFETKDGKLMMLPTDMALIQDPEFKKWVEIYAKDEERFFKDFADVFSRLLELGVKF